MVYWVYGHIFVTPLRPDLFLVDESEHVAVIFELTCPWETNIDRNHEVHDYKQAKYAPPSPICRKIVSFIFLKKFLRMVILLNRINPAQRTLRLDAAT